MKRNNHIVRALLLLMVVAFVSSCKKDFGDVNVNPNEPTDVPVNIILPSAEASLAYTLGGDIARYNGVFDQNITGADRQFAGYNSYIFTSDDFNNLWNNMYAGNMADLNRIIEKANAADGSFNSYRGVAKILMAYSLMTVTDLWGDVPFREAFKGNDNTTPVYDSQDEIYTQILPELLDGGIADIDNSSNDQLTPGADDVIFGGDLDMWKKFAHGIKARMYIHQTKVASNVNAVAQSALDEAILSFGPGEGARFQFGTNYQSPWFQYIDQRADISYSSLDAYYGIGCYLTDTLEALSDPRFAKMIDVNGDYYAAGFPSAYYMADDAKITLLSDFEVGFIAAEANYLLNNDAAAQAALESAISGSFVELGLDVIDAQAYVTANVDWANSTDKLGLIMFQKYLANYLQPESYNDWRRTGYPDLAPNDGAASGQIPRRYIYPTNEIQNNPNSSNSAGTLYAPKLWWDNR